MRESTAERALLIGGKQRIFKFANGLGASVVRGQFTYGGDQGLWELAVVKFDGDGEFDFSITYDNPITDDVVGRLSESAVDTLLNKIEALP